MCNIIICKFFSFIFQGKALVSFVYDSQIAVKLLLAVFWSYTHIDPRADETAEGGRGGLEAYSGLRPGVPRTLEDGKRRSDGAKEVEKRPVKAENISVINSINVAEDPSEKTEATTGLGETGR